MVKQLFFRDFSRNFGATIKGVKFCRPNISVDGTHLYERFNGKLLIPVVFDVVNEIIPFSYDLIEE